MRIARFLLLSFACIFTACVGDDDPTPGPEPTLDHVYFPLELNRPLVYEQDSIVLYRTLTGVRYDTSHSQVREELVEEFVNGDGQVSYRGERYQRSIGGTWQFVQSYLVSRSRTVATRSEDNLTFIKLVFPIRPTVNWNGHSAFDENVDIAVGAELLDVYKNWTYHYSDEPEDVMLNGQTLNDTWVVQQAEVDNLIDRRVAYERYAPGVGLVERFIDARHTQCQVCCNGDTGSCVNLPWDEKAEKGFILKQTILQQ